ncbi:MAG: cytochrome D1 [Pyrinomonadaceae bacterium]|nr:cytochrome D1 [Pyrinomonadaceae bacterium]
MFQFQYSTGRIARIPFALLCAFFACFAVRRNQTAKNAKQNAKVAEIVAILVAVIAQLSSSVIYAQSPTERARVPSGSTQTQKYEQEGVGVEFSMDPVPAGTGHAAKLLAGTEATIRFKIYDANTRKALNNLRPAAWLDLRDAGAVPGARECREKVQSFLQASFTRRPSLDLNSYFILALNNEPNISVIDPLSGFGGTKLITLVALPSPGEDWVMSADKKRLYVSLPRTNQVAVIDVANWKVVANVEAGVNPSRLVLQNDGRYLWVGNDAANETDSGVTVIDTTTLKVAARVSTGLGHHEIVLTPNDRSAFITNKESGTLSVVDGRSLTRVKDIKVGALPVSLAFSALSQAVYVANEGDGTVFAINSARFETLAKLPTAPGIRTVRISPDGRYGFVVNQATSVVYIFDLSTHRLAHTVPVGSKPDQITFTQQFAYVRAAGSEFVTMINLAGLGKEAAISRFPGGQKAPQDSLHASLAGAMVPAPEPGAVLVANAADKMIYFYTEGMAAPMGSFQNYKREPRAILVLNNSLRETEPGVYSTNVRLTGAGTYDVALLLDTPRLVNCFNLTIAENPDHPKEQAVPIKVEMLPGDTALRVGKEYKVRFKVTDAKTNQPKPDLEDMGVLVFLAPGIWQQRAWAKPAGNGAYEMSFVPPEPGVYYVFFQSPSLGVKLNQIQSVTLTATKDESK